MAANGIIKKLKFPFHSQPFLLTCPELIKQYDVLSSVFFYDIESLIAQLKGCLLDCFDWEINSCVVLVR